MRAHAKAAGLDDAVIVNTCAVTSEAVRQARQTIRKARRERPDARIIVTGCAAQIAPETFADMDEVDHVLGNDVKMQLESFEALRAGSLGRVRVNDIMSVRETAGHLIGGFGTRARAYVEVQNGCDHRCTFCIIPYGRGNSRSVPVAHVVEQVRRLVDHGYREVVLTGVDMTSYGGDLDAHPRGPMTLGRLVQAILTNVPDLERLRLSSIDSIEADEPLIEAITGASRLMPHLHLSLQAGHDMTLKRMKRRHLRDDSIRFCADMRAARPELVFGADLIAGFPTETDAMFDATLALVDDCGLTHLHVFPFSPREGTPAAKMPPVARGVVKARAERLRVRGAQALTRHLAAQVGRELPVLLERADLGRTPDFTEVIVGTPTKHTRTGVGDGVGSVQTVRMTGHNGRRLLGELTE